MSHAKLITGVLLLALSVAAQAQTYRWTDKEGRVHYTDTPPPKEAVKAEEKNLRGNIATGGDLPYAVQEAMKKYPVKLFTAEKCDPCAQGRALLTTRGIPFHEIAVKDAASQAELKKVQSANEVPVLVVGGDIRKGFNPQDWNAALDGAGYPQTATPGVKLPDPVAPAAPPAKKEELGPYSPR